MTSEEPLSTLRSAVGRGEGLLVLGQDHTPALIDSLLLDAKNLFGSSQGWQSFPQLCTAVGTNRDAQTAIASLLASAEPDVALVEVASLPWMAVVTSAVDPVLAKAFLAAGSQRRLVELGPTQISGISAGRAGQVLQLIRAFGVIDSGEAPLTVPVSTGALAETRLLQLPLVARALPRLLGVHGRIVIDGVTDRDWLDDQALAPLLLVLSSLPVGTVYWFGSAPGVAKQALLGKASFFADRFDAILLEWAKDDTFAAEVKSARGRVFGIGDHTVTLDESGKSFTLRFTASEWRSISAVGSMIDDAAVSGLAGPSVPTRHDLIGFLRKSHAGVPDWSGPARGLVFERQSVQKLIKAAKDFIATPKASVRDPTGQGGGLRRVPFVLSGPPASGKTMGLLHAAWTLRAHSRLCVLWLFRRALGPDAAAIERVCRMLEAKGVGWTVLCLDSPDPDEYGRLKRRLEAEGRRILVLATESAADSATHPEGSGGSDSDPRFSLGLRLQKDEALSFLEFLRRFGLSPQQQSQDDFLRVLADAIPEAQFGAFPSLLDEYERLLAEVREIGARDQPAAHAKSPGSLAAKLRTALPHLAMTPEQVDVAVSRFEAVPILRELLRVVLFCSQLDRPVPVDFVVKIFGAELIAAYPQLGEAFANTALIDEVELDAEGSLALTAIHQLHALWLLRGLVPDRSEQLSILEQLTNSVDWDDAALPGDNAFQDFALELFRAVGPRGENKELYSATPSLVRLCQIVIGYRV